MEKTEELIRSAEALTKKGQWEEASNTLAKALVRFEKEPEDLHGKKQLSLALRLKALADSRRGNHKLAVEGAQRAMTISLSIGDLEGEAEALRRLGYIHWQKADYPMALEFYNSALEKADKAGARKLVGCIKIEVANTYNYIGDVKMAMRVYNDSIKILEDEKDYHEMGRALNNMGSSQMHAGNFDEAVKLLTRAIQVCDNIGNVAHKGWAAFNIAECHLKLGAPEKGLPFLEMASNILADTDDKVGLTITYMIYGEIYTALKRWDDAIMSFDNAVRLERKLQMPSLEGEIIRERGKMFIDKGDREKGILDLKRAVDLFISCDQKKDAEEVQAILKNLDA